MKPFLPSFLLGIVFTTTTIQADVMVRFYQSTLQVENHDTPSFASAPDTHMPPCEPVDVPASHEEEISDWERFTESVIWVESKGNPERVGDNGKAVGVLQEWCICIDEANRLLGYNRFSYEDRYDRERSIEVWNVIQGCRNPERDFKKACQIWNPTAGDWYYERIMERFYELENQ